VWPAGFGQDLKQLPDVLLARDLVRQQEVGVDRGTVCSDCFAGA
jgi:hypothetical protein